MASLSDIVNGESGASVRAKLNKVLPFVNSAGGFLEPNIKIGGAGEAALNALDVAGNISLSSAGANVIRMLQSVGAAGYVGPGFYSASDIGYGVANGGEHIFIGIDGNTEIGRFDDVGGFRVGSAGQSFVTPFINFRKDVDDATLLRVENQNSGNAARAMVVAQGEPSTSPATHARYMAMSVTSTTYGGGSVVGTIVPPNTGFLQTGGNLIGGMLLYADDGPIQIANDLHFGMAPCIYVSPYSLDGVAQTNPGMIGFGLNTPTARLDIVGGTATYPSFRLRDSVAPTGGSLADGVIWQDGANLKIRIGGVTKTVTLT